MGPGPCLPNRPWEIDNESVTGPLFLRWDFIWFGPALGVVVSAADAKRGSALRYSTGKSPFPSTERRASVGKWESTPRRFRSTQRRSVSPLPENSPPLLEPLVVPEFSSSTDSFGVPAPALNSFDEATLRSSVGKPRPIRVGGLFGRPDSPPRNPRIGSPF